MCVMGRIHKIICFIVEVGSIRPHQGYFLLLHRTGTGSYTHLDVYKRQETGRGSSDKGGDGQDALIFRQQLIETIAHGGGTVQRGSLREIDLDGELIPVGYRHHTLAQLSDHQDRQGNRQDA